MACFLWLARDVDGFKVDKIDAMMSKVNALGLTWVRLRVGRIDLK